MNKAHILLGLSFITITGGAANLLPGAKVYHLVTVPYNDTNTPTPITGKIINLTPETPLNATNYITVPNSFPKTITDSGDYQVSPPISKSGYEIWTKGIKYVDENGKGCLIQFAWDPASKTADIGLTSLNTDYWGNCKMGIPSGGPFGTNVTIDNSQLH